MNKSIIDFKVLFELLSDVSYSVVKLDPNFPNYIPGQDIDIFCRDVEEVSRKTIGYLVTLVDDNFCVKVSKKSNQIHVDLMEGRSIHFRFDLIGELPKYERVIVKPSFFDIIIESSIEKTVAEVVIKAPGLIDEGVLRYIEYGEYINIRADKLKHIEWILEAVGNSTELKDAFFQRVHYFLTLPQLPYQKKSFLLRLKDSIFYLNDLVSKGIYVIKREGISKFLSKVRAQFFKKM